MRIIHISPKKYHPCLWKLIKTQSRNHSIFYFILYLLENVEHNVIKEYKEKKIIFTEINIKKSVDYSFDIGLRKIFDSLIKKHRPDLIHIHLFSGVSIIPILNVASSLGIKKIVTLHDHSLLCLRGIFHKSHKKCEIQSIAECDCNECRRFAQKEGITLTEYNRIREERIKSVVNMCDKIICCSHTQREIACKLLGNNFKFVTLYYGVDLPRVNKFIKKKSEFPTFGYLGSLSPLKSISTIENAITYLNDYEYEILMGIRCKPDNFQDVTYLERLGRYKNLKIFKNIAYSKLYSKFFSQIDYLIIPSVWEETGPMTLFESFFYKVPVIISNRRSMVEKIERNKGSKIFNNTKELVKIMKEIIEGKIKKEETDIFNVKSINQYSEGIEFLYQEVIGKQIKTIKVKTGYTCNNRCIFCVTGDNYPKTHIDFAIIKHNLEKYRENYEKLILTGGEPSIRNDFLTILELAYRLGYKISLETNARIFSNKEFCEKIKYYNLDIIAHIESYKPHIHDLITRIPGSFNEAIKGIKNLRKHCRKMTIKIMLTKINYKHILYTVKFITNLDVDKIHFVFLTPWGNAYLYFDAIVPSYSEVEPFLNNALAWLKNNSKIDITVEGFPHCFIDSKFRDFVFEKPIEDKSVMFGIYPSGLPSSEHKYYIFKERPNQKQKFPQCKICKFDKICEGVYKRYVERRGDNEFIPIRDITSKSN